MTLTTPLFQIAPHPLRGTNDANSERVVTLSAEFRAASGATDEHPIIEITSTSTGEDRNGSRIFEWLDETYMRTGHVLWQHGEVPDYPYIGKKLSSRQVGDKSVSEIELLIGPWRHFENSHGNLPAFLWETFRDFGMGAMSRAFIPLKMKSRQATTIPTQVAENIDYLVVEQVEESFVNVPSNRDSFARAIARKRAAGKFNDRLARTLGYDVTPTVIDSRGSSAMKKTEAFRSRIADVLKRCCGCDSYREPEPEVITDAEKIVDVASITTLVTAQLAVLDAAMAAWKATASTTARGTFSNIAVSAMYSIEWLIYRAGEWYDAEISVAIPDISMADMEEIAGGADVALTAPAGATRTATPSRARVATLRSLVRSSRESMRDYWVEYADCGPVIIETCSICWTPLAVGCDCADVVDDATAAVEQQSIANAMDVYSRLLVASLAGWDGAKHDALRDFFSMLVNDCLWRVDRLLDMQEYWYADATPGQIATVDAGQMRKFVAAIRKNGAPKPYRRAAAAEDEAEPTTPEESLKQLNDAAKELMQLWNASDKGDDDAETVMQAFDDAEDRIDTACDDLKADATTDDSERSAPRIATRSGAEFSKKNKKAIRSIHGHAQEAATHLQEIATRCMEMVNDTTDTTGDATDAGNTDDQSGDARSIRVIGPSSSGREDGAGHTFRVSAADTPDAGAGERSNHQAQPPLYGGTTLRVKRQ